MIALKSNAPIINLHEIRLQRSQQLRPDDKDSASLVSLRLDPKSATDSQLSQPVRSSTTMSSTSLSENNDLIASLSQPIETDKYPIHMSTAQLPVLPEPLRLKNGPLLVTLRWWNGGSVSADLPCCALYGEGENDTAALEDLGDTILDWARGIVALGGRGKLGGPLLRQWDALTSLVDVSGL